MNDVMIPGAVNAIVRANQKRTRVGLGVATVMSETGVNRRGITQRHQIGAHLNKWAVYDPEMTVLRFESTSGTLANIVHYGAHPTVLAGDSTSCGNNGYFPTRESLHRGGYETWIGQALGAYLLAEDIDDVLVEENLKLIEQLHGSAYPPL